MINEAIHMSSSIKGVSFNRGVILQGHLLEPMEDVGDVVKTAQLVHSLDFLNVQHVDVRASR